MATTTAEFEAPRERDETVGARIVRFLSKGPIYALLIFIGLLWLVPTLGLFITSLLAPSDFNEGGWWQIFSEPGKLTTENYSRLFDTPASTSSLWTTVWIALLGTFLPLFVAALAGYAFAWLEFPGRDWLFILVIALLVVPLQMALIPIFSLYNTFGIFDTVIGIALFHTAFGLPFAIFLLRNFFIGIPKDILESARIDGASELRIFFRLILPLGVPALASLAIFQFLWTWNDLLVALTFVRSTQQITVAIYSQLRQFGQNIDLIATASFVSLIVPLVVFFAFQRYFVRGVLAGSVK